MKRGSTDICALVAIDKSEGCTSHDVVNAVRRATGERRVGHCGTLDPFATGLLIVGIGPATRLSDYVMGGRKSYCASIRFGIGTDTDDLTGHTVESSNVDERFFDIGFANDSLKSIIGVQRQLPPSYSAKKVDGVKSYDAARKGETIDLEPVEIEIFSASLLSIDTIEDFDSKAAIWNVEFEVSKGTYIRAIARDLGIALGCPAHLSALRRTTIGEFRVDRAIALEEFVKLAENGMLEKAFIDPVRICELRPHEINDYEMERVRNGAKFSSICKCDEAETLALVKDGRMHAIYKAVESFDGENGVEKARLCACVVIPGGVAGVGTDL